MVALFVFTTFVLFITADVIYSRVAKRAAVPAMQMARPVLSYPTGLFFSKGHTWASLAGENSIQVGLGDFITNLVGKIDSIEVASGAIKAGQPLITIKQGAKVLTFNSPVDGTVSGINRNVIANPELLRERPLNHQWVASIESSEPARQLRPLQMANEAKSWIMQEAARFVDSYSMIFGKTEYATSLADGGSLVEGALGYGDEEAWKKFQTSFL